jgi:hypothetical protein
MSKIQQRKNCNPRDYVPVKNSTSSGENCVMLRHLHNRWKYIVMCMSDYSRGLDLRLDLLTTLPLDLCTINYSAIAYLHTLQITTAHAMIFQSAESSPVVPW